MKPKHKASHLLNLCEQYWINLALYHQEPIKHMTVVGADHWCTDHTKRNPGLRESSRQIISIFTQVWVFHSIFPHVLSPPLILLSYQRGGISANSSKENPGICKTNHILKIQRILFDDKSKVKWYEIILTEVKKILLHI